MAFTTAGRLLEIFREDSERIASLCRSSESALMPHPFFQANPITSAREASKALPFSLHTVHAAAERLVGLGVLREFPRSGKTRIFAYARYLDELSRDVPLWAILHVLVRP